MGAAIEAAMLEAHRAGLSVIPLRENKRPDVSSWAGYVDTQPDELDVVRWGQSHDGFAMICGGSQRTQVLDFEARFTSECWHSFVMALEDDELLATFNTWLEGYTVITPSGGLHVAVHLIGDGPQPGNQPLARDADGRVLAETRGHGGYVAAAPSNGTTHPSGGQWVQRAGTFAEIAWATPEEWAAVCAVISQFDAVAASESPPEALPPRALPGGLSLSTIERGGNSWIADVRKPPMAVVLADHGWAYDHTDRDGIHYWVRPDKPPRDGHSATINPNDRLHMFSEDGLPVPVSRNNYTESFDSIDVMGCYEFGHLPNDDERTAIFRRLAGRTQPGHIPVDIRVPEPTTFPADFWTERPWLAATREDALDRLISPEAMYGAVISTWSTTIPPNIKVPRMVGAASPLGMYVALVGATGAGKSTAMVAARELLGLQSNNDFLYGKGLRSGEGLIPLALLPPPKLPRGADPPDPAWRSGVQVSFDEIKALQNQADRAGGSTLSYLISAWSGLSELGGAKAAGVESIPLDQCQFSAMFGVQPGVAAALFTGEPLTQGFPGRLLYFNCNSQDVQDEPDERPDRARVPVLGLPRWLRSEGQQIGEMEVPSFVETEVRRWRKARLAEENADPVRAHEMLNKARLACVHGLMDSSAQMEDVHWQLSGVVQRTSDAVRDTLYERAHDDTRKRARAAGEYDAIRDDAKHDHWVAKRAKALAQAAHHSPLTARQVKDMFNKDQRPHADEVVRYAIERNWVQHSVDGRRKLLIAGERQPS